MDPVIIWLIVAALLLAVLGYLAYRYLGDYLFGADGLGAPKRMRGVLSRYAFSRRFKILDDLRFGTKDGEVSVQSALIGFFGILLVHTVGGHGEFYGEPESKEWVCVRDGKRRLFPNPYLEQRNATREIRAVLSKGKVYNVPILQVVVFTGHAKKTTVSIACGDDIVQQGRLGAYLDRAKFDHDAEIDLERVAALLTPCCRKA